MASHTQRLGRVAMVPRGEWDETATYERLDVVTSGGSSYMAVADVAAGTPVTDTASWQLVASAGGQGRPGDKGDPGKDADVAAAAAATEAANGAAGKAEAAATAASEAASDASSAASDATTAASSATEAASAASSAASSATESAKGADSAKAAAEKAAGAATSSATAAGKAADTANEAAAGATGAAGSAGAAAKSANDAAADARSATDAASKAAAAAAAATEAANGAAGKAEAAAEKTDALTAELEWDEVSGEYPESALRGLILRNSNSLLYGVSIPKSAATACSKTHANAGIANPVPSTLAAPGADPYAIVRGPFLHVRVNGFVDADGRPHVTAVEGDPRYAVDGSNGDVWVMAPVLWWSMVDAGDTVELAVSDTRRPGLKAQPKAYLPDGSLRPYVLYAAYGGSKGADGSMRSVSGAQLWTRTVSHNNLIDITKSATTGYSGKSLADDWYPKVMFLLKYANKSSQSVFAGCANYTYGYAPTVAETGVTRVVMQKSQAANFIVGSSVMLGTANGKGEAIDRGNAAARDVFDARTVLRVEVVDESTSAIVVDGEPFDTAATMWFQTAPWPTGCCDGVRGDGSPNSVTNSREPYVLQGIEMSYGAYEMLSDAVLVADGEVGEQVYTLADTAKASKSAPTADYLASGAYMPSGEAAAWRWPLYPASAGGYLVGQGEGGSSTSGMGDAVYTPTRDNKGVYIVLSLGNPVAGASCGLWYVYGTGRLGWTGWDGASRLSGLGRSGGESA